MDACLDLIIPQPYLSEDFQLVEELVGWGEGQYPQDPPKYRGSSVVTFTRRLAPDHIAKYLPKNLDVSEWVCLSLDDGFLGVWEKEVNQNAGMTSDVPLKLFLSEFLGNVNSWVLVFELNCDQIDRVLEASSSDLIAKIENVLNWSNKPEGFIALSVS